MRVPPSLANSATTPAFRLFTSSMNRGGNDHSRPTMTPTFFIGLRPLSIAELKPENQGPFGALKFRIPQFSVVSADVHSCHLVPHGPIVCEAVPFAECVADALAPQLTGEFAVLVQEAVVTADR